MRIFFSVGEPSGDLHGANLIAALRRQRPDWHYVGYGGPRMAAAGCRCYADLTQLAIMWFARVLLNLHRFIGLLVRADRIFREERPDAVVLIDYPGFNWWIARRAKAHGIPVVYYGAPQLWAWASYRIRRMRRYVDYVLCKLPFEEHWYRARGCQAKYLGHPYFDALRSQQFDQAFLASLADDERPLVAILPGSRTQEVESNLAEFLKAAEQIGREAPQVRFAIAAFNAAQAGYAQSVVDAAGLGIPVYVGRTGELIRASHSCLACSGSVSLELLYHARPAVILYQVGRFGYFVQQFFRKVRYITLVNLLTAADPTTTRPAGNYDPADPRDRHVLLPEYLTCTDKSGILAGHILQWISQPNLYRERVEQLTQLRDSVGQGGASEKAADFLVDLLDSPGSLESRAA